MIYIPKEKKKIMSYTHEDVDRFIQAMIGDALRLGTTPAIGTDKCVGLENLLSRNVARRVATNKRRHASLILQGQWYYSKEALAQLGRMSSSWASDKAQVNAARNLKG